MSRTRSWNDDDLRRAVLGPPAATSLAEVTARLGLVPNGATNKLLRGHATRLGLTLPQLPPGRPRKQEAS